MKRVLIAALVLPLLVLGSVRFAAAHCEVPCGIYADQMRFEQMLEDQETIAKAMANIADLSAKTDALSVNQCGRWIATKEDHAKKTQHTIAQYFMAQRIKADNPDYVKQLTAAHAVIVAAMKCKQNVDPEVAESLKKAVLDLYRAYEGKEPVFHDHD